MRWEHLLAAAVWDADSVRDDLPGCVVAHLGGPAAVLVADETSDVRRALRRYDKNGPVRTGTAGRIEIAQVTVYLLVAGPPGHAVLDRELSLSAAWADDLDRRPGAGVPAQMTFATTPALARQMVTRALTPVSRRGGSPATRSTVTTPPAP